MENTANEKPDNKWLNVPIIATITRLLCRELTFQNEYLRQENKILKSKINKRFSFTDGERRILVDAALAMGKDISTISHQLMGGQDHKFNIHYSVFNYHRLSELLKKVGFRKVVSWAPNNCLYHNFKDRASPRIKVNGKEYMISLNLEAIK